MNKYEVMYILNANLDEEARKTAIETVNGILVSNGATVTKVDESMGMRELAYPIKDETKGYYVVIKVSADEAALLEFDRKVKNNSSVLRHLVVVDHE